MSDVELEWSPSDAFGPVDPRTTLGRPAVPLDDNRAYEEFVFEIPDPRNADWVLGPLKYAVWNIRLAPVGERVIVGYVLLKRRYTTGQIYGLFRQGVEVMCYELAGTASEHAVSIEDMSQSLFGINRAMEHYSEGVLETGIEVRQQIYVEEAPL